MMIIQLLNQTAQTIQSKAPLEKKTEAFNNLIAHIKENNPPQHPGDEARLQMTLMRMVTPLMSSPKISSLVKRTLIRNMHTLVTHPGNSTKLS